MSGLLLTQVLRDPSIAAALDPERWSALIAAARAEQIVGTLAHRLNRLPIPVSAARILADHRASAAQGRTAALWEAEMARRALESLDVPVVLLKGAAYVAAGLKAGQGRSIGDLDILVPCDRIDAVEAALLVAGWEWVKPDPYDDAYYREWMHELPPLIHRERDRMIDVHHTILPLTARITPDAGALIADSVTLENGLRVLNPEDMICHSVAHLFADGDLAGGLRNLWDIHCLLEEFADEGFDARLVQRARLHGLTREVARALRLRAALYTQPVRAEPVGPKATGGQPLSFLARRKDSTPTSSVRTDLGFLDRLFLRRLTARDGWGRQTRKLTELAFYLRSHWLRMPPAMLARHLWTKWRRGYRPPA